MAASVESLQKSLALELDRVAKRGKDFTFKPWLGNAPLDVPLLLAALEAWCRGKRPIGDTESRTAALNYLLEEAIDDLSETELIPQTAVIWRQTALEMFRFQEVNPPYPEDGKKYSYILKNIVERANLIGTDRQHSRKISGRVRDALAASMLARISEADRLRLEREFTARIKASPTGEVDLEGREYELEDVQSSGPAKPGKQAVESDAKPDLTAKQGPAKPSTDSSQRRDVTVSSKEVSQRPKSRKPILPVIISIAALVGAGGVVVQVFDPFAGADRTSQSTGPSSPITSGFSVQPPASSTVKPVAQAVQVNSISFFDPFGWHHTYVYPSRLDLTPAELAELNATNGNEAGYIAWNLRHGGVKTGMAGIDISLHGLSGKSVLIKNLHVKSTCGKPLTGAIVHSPSGASHQDVLLGIDLSKQFPTAQKYQNGKFLPGNYFDETGVELKSGDTVSFKIHAVASPGKHCKFTLTLDVNTGEDGPVKQEITNGGKPFEVSGVTSARSYGAVYIGGTESFVGNNQFSYIDPASLPDDYFTGPS